VNRESVDSNEDVNSEIWDLASLINASTSKSSSSVRGGSNFTLLTSSDFTPSVILSARLRIEISSSSGVLSFSFAIFFSLFYSPLLAKLAYSYFIFKNIAPCGRRCGKLTSLVSSPNFYN